MIRIPEPEIMNDKEQVEAYASADFADSLYTYINHFRTSFPYFKEGKILDLGCGPAFEAIELCKEYDNIHITCIDASKEMLLKAEEFVQKAGMKDRITLINDHIPECKNIEDEFDAVVSKDLLHHLLNPLDLWNTAAKFTKPGAQVMVMDLIRPDSEYEANKIVEKTAASNSPILQKDFYNSLCAAYTTEEINEQIIYSEYESIQPEIFTVNRHFIVAGNKQAYNTSLKERAVAFY